MRAMRFVTTEPWQLNLHKLPSKPPWPVRMPILCILDRCMCNPPRLLPVTVALVRTAREPLSHARSRTAASSQANTLGPKCSLNWKARQGWKNAMPARAPLSASNSALQNLKCIVQPTRLHHPAFLQALPIGRKRGKPAIDLVNLPPAWWLVVGNSEPVSPGGAQQEGTGCPYVGAGNTP